jgi:hypothetical protein
MMLRGFCCLLLSDVTIAAIDTIVPHILAQSGDKPHKFRNPIWPSAIALTSNGRQMCIQSFLLAHEYLMESSRSPLSNGSSLITKFMSVICN